MDSVTRNVYMAVFLLLLGLVMLMTGIGLFVSGDPEASGKASRVGCPGVSCMLRLILRF